MKTINVLILTFTATLLAHADFSYTTAAKSGDATAAVAGNRPSKYYFKGSKMKVESGDSTIIFDMDAQTLTAINTGQKTYSVTPFSSLGETIKQTNLEANVDIKDTGERKNINGYNASQLIMTMTMDAPQPAGRGAAMKMMIEMEMWLSKDVPGAQELRSFYQKNMNSFPWAALGGAGNPGLQKAMVEMQKKVASAGGVPVLQVVRTKAAGGNDPQAAQMQQKMNEARAQLEAMSKQGGPQAAAAQQALARMGGLANGGASGALFEMTTESRDFSTSSIPDSAFAVPAGFQKVDRK